MIWVVPFLVLIGIFAGPVLVGMRETWNKRGTYAEQPWNYRLVGWSVLMLIVAGAHFSLKNSDPIVRMVGICCVLLGGMKGLVYAEWAGGGKLPFMRYCVFAFLWFGMDPASFRNRRAGLAWKQDIWIGVGLMILGTLGAWLVWMMQWRQILVMFVPMSIGFHFGTLRVLKGGLRAAGFPVRTLFPNLLDARGVGDFWSRRWNVGYSQMMQRLIGRPVQAVAGESAGVMAVFIGSGLLHELAITLPVQSGFGLPTLYFTLHGGLTLIEKRTGRQFGKIPALLAVGLPLSFLFPPAFQTEVIARCLGVFELVRSL